MRYLLAAALVALPFAASAQTAGTLAVKDANGTTQTLPTDVNGSNNTPHSVPEVAGARVSTGNPLPTVQTGALPAGTNTIGAMNNNATAASAPPALSAGIAPMSMTLTGGMRVQLQSGGVDVSTLPISAAALPLPAGAATAANQANQIPGTVAGTTATSANPVQGVTGGVPLRDTITPNVATPTSCGGTTSATVNTSTALLAASLWTYHLMLQNNGTVPVLVSFIAAAGTTLTGTNSYTLIAGQTFTNPDTMPSGTLVTVASATASQPVMCEYK